MNWEPLEDRRFFSASTSSVNAPDPSAETAPAVTETATVGATPHQNHLNHKHHLHTLHRQHLHRLHLSHLHRLHLHHLHQLHLHRLHLHRLHLHRVHLHHRHHLHTLHVAHFLRSSHPKPLVLSAQQRNDWAELRDSLLKNRPRVPN